MPEGTVIVERGSSAQDFAPKLNRTAADVVRFLLGAAEAGFFPGLIVYLSHWFRYEDRAKAVAWFMAWVRKHGFAPFAVYRLLAGAAVLYWVWK